MPAADVMVFPSRLEGSSNALAEAVACGRAIATTPAGDAESLLGGAGVVSGGWTPEAFGDAICQAVDQADALQARCETRAKALAAERSSAIVGARWARTLGF